MTHDSTPPSATGHDDGGEHLDPDPPVVAPPHPHTPFTLAIDIGGTGLKASVLDASGAMMADRVRVATPYPVDPAGLVAALVELIKPLPTFDRVSVGFPGMVREGRTITAPHFVTKGGPGSDIDHGLVEAWSNFEMAAALSEALAKPVRMANDADLQGAAVVKGDGFELVITLGTGFGTAMFYKGRLLPHMEFAHHYFRKGDTYDDQVGDAARKAIGDERWRERVHKAIKAMRNLVFFDHCYIGGGNSRRLANHLPDDVTIVDNSAGILGGIKLWESDHIGI